MAVSGDEQKLIPMVEKAVQMVSDAFEFALVQKEEQVRLLEAHNRQLEDRIGELKMLVQLMEDKYQVRY